MGTVYLILALLALLYVYFKRCYSYYSTKGVPTIPPTIPFGNLGNPLTRKHAFYITGKNLYDTYKLQGHRFGCMYAATQGFFLTVDPKLAKLFLQSDFHSFVGRGLYYNEKWDPLSANLFFIEGLKWRNLRAKLTPTFTSGKMRTMFRTLLECTGPMVNGVLAKRCKIDAKDLVACFTTDVIGSCAFGLDCNSFKDPDSEFRRYGKSVFEFGPLFTLSRMFCMMFPNLAKPLRFRFVSKDTNDFFFDLVDKVVQYRESQNVTRNDFMQLLLELKRNGELGQDDMAAQAFVFFIAGFETSSTTLTHCLYELAMHQDIQERVRSEILANVPQEGLTYDHMSSMVYTQQVIDETLRKYPVVPFLSRSCTEPYQVPGTSIMLNPDDRILIPVFGFHQDPEYFPEPQRFDPDRFSEQNKSKIVPFTYLPFGEGPRICIGSRFGNMQVKVALISILKRFRIRLNEATPTELTWHPNSFILKSNETIYLDAEQITN